MSRRITIEDVARQANASVSTVSMVMRNKPGISAETRQRVLNVARELGYRRRAVPTGRSTVHNVAMILRSRTEQSHAQLPSVNPFYSEVINGIETTARSERTSLLYATLPVGQSNQPLDLPEHVLNQTLDGILLIGAFSEQTVSAIADLRSTPTILVDAPARPSAYDAVVSNNEGGAYNAVRYLIDRGHRQIALVGPDLDADPNLGQRRQGYLNAMHAQGLTPVFVANDRVDMRAMAEAVTATLNSQPEITAIFGANDASAIEAMRGATDAGRRVPDDISVIGFDDVARASQSAPPLTTMAVDRITMGRHAIHLLHHRLTWPDSCPIMSVLQPKLCVRESTATVSISGKHHTPGGTTATDSG